MAGSQEAALLGSFLAEHEDRIARHAARMLKGELDSGLSRDQRKRSAPSYVGELASLLLERGDDAARLWGEAVRHYGGRAFEERRDIGDMIREFKVLELVIRDEWARRAGAMEGEVSALLSGCIAEGTAAAVSDYVRHLRGQRVEFRESALIETLLDNLDEGILLIESDGTFSFATKPSYELFGPGLEGALGRQLGDPIFGALFAALDARHLDGTPLDVAELPAATMLRTGVAAEPLIVRVRPGGRERILEMSALPIFHEEEEAGGRAGRESAALRGIIVTARDRTTEVLRAEELRLANRELAEMQSRLLRRSRSQAMGELATGAAHALNNLLNSMHLRLQLLRERPGPQQVAELERSVADIAQLVQRLQQFASQRPAGPAESANLAAVVNEVLVLVRPEARRGGEHEIQVEVELAQTPPIRANTVELREHLVSLLLYARDQLSGGGTLFINSCLGASGVELHLGFRDGGARPPEAALRGGENWLEPFLGPQAPESLALAASNAREALERWGGSLKSSIGERGVELVLCFAVARPEVQAEPAHAAPAAGPQRILVVDDDPDNAAMLAEVLSAEGHQTETALTGQQAIERWGGATFDVALVDLLMPDMSGLDIARELRRLQPSARVAMVTGWDLDDEQMRSAPVHAVFRKPVDLERLVEFLATPGKAPEAPAPPEPEPAPGP